MFATKAAPMHCMLTMRSVTVAESRFPIPVTRCLGVLQSCPSACVFMGGQNRQPNVRYVANLGEAGYDIPADVAPIHKDVLEYIGNKPVTYRLFDEHIQSNFRGGIKEYADRVEITFDPLSRRGSYTLAHEFGHALTGKDPNGVYLDPARVRDEDGEDRKIASQVASIVDHPTVHCIIEGYGFDTSPECIERTAEANKTLTERNAKLIDESRAKGASAARRIALDNAQMLTTYRCDATAEFEDRIRRFFCADTIADTDKVVAFINQRTDGALSPRDASVAILDVVGHANLADFYVDRPTFEKRLLPWSAE